MTLPQKYNPSSHQARWIAVLAVMPPEGRRDTITELAEREGHQFVAALLDHVIGMANSVVENCREWVETEAIILGAVHPDQAHQINTPDMLGAALGAEKAAQVRQEGLCSGCALRLGALANQCLPTQADLDYVEKADGEKFLCHMDGLDAGEPRKVCPGWARWQALKIADRQGAKP